MSDVEVSTWSATDASNTTAAPDGAPNNFARTSTKNILRAIMGGVKRLRDRMTPTLTAAGTAPAFTLTYTGAPPAYVQGHVFAFKAHDATGGNMTLNVNTLGAKKVYDVTGTTQLTTGAFIANTRMVVSYDTALDGGSGGFVWLNQGAPVAASETAAGVVELATDAEAQTGTDTARAITPANLQAVTATDTRAGVAEIATQAEQETGSDTGRIVTPGRQHFHASAAKAWGELDGSGTASLLTPSYNMTSMTDNGTGDFTWTIATDFSSANYAGLATCGQADSATGAVYATGPMTSAQAAGTFRVVTSTVIAGAITPSDPERLSVVFFGDQA